MATLSKSAATALKIKETATRLGWKVMVRGSVLTIVKYFPAGNNDKLVECDMEYYDILGLLPGSGGSVWGTDCGGIGAYSALKSGVFRMNKSGGQKRVLQALAKIV
ncbi:MAG: hypothetical protein ACWGQW_01960 [bacterium]